MILTMWSYLRVTWNDQEPDFRGDDDFYNDDKYKKKPKVVKQDSDEAIGNIEEDIPEDPFNNTGGNRNLTEEPFEEEIIDDEVEGKKHTGFNNKTKKITEDSFNKTNPKHFARVDTKSRIF